MASGYLIRPVVGLALRAIALGPTVSLRSCFGLTRPILGLALRAIAPGATVSLRSCFGFWHNPCNPVHGYGHSCRFTMFDPLSNSPMVQSMDRAMTIANRRMDLVAGNLANLDTPGYRTRDIDFQESLKTALQELPGQELPMTRTDPRHLGGGSGSLDVHPQEVTTGQERNDGNNVNLDRETMLLQRTQSSYVLASTFLQGEVRRTLQAIRDAKA